MHRDAVNAICDYVDDYLFEPKNNWPDLEFLDRSASRWAAFEIVKALCTDDHRSACDIANEFYRKMKDFAERSRTPRTRYIFESARDTAEVIVLFLV